MNFNLNNINYSCVPMYNQNNKQVIAYSCSNKQIENFETTPPTKWDSNTRYFKDAIVFYRGYKYKVIDQGYPEGTEAGITPDSLPNLWEKKEVQNPAISLIPDYNSSKKYYSGNLVSYENSVYVASTDVDAGITPSNNSKWSRGYDSISLDQEAVQPSDYAGFWNDSTTYTSKDIVSVYSSQDGKGANFLFKSKTNRNSNKNPWTDRNNWERIDYRYDALWTYKPNEVVYIYGNNNDHPMRCIKESKGNHPLNVNSSYFFRYDIPEFNKRSTYFRGMIVIYEGSYYKANSNQISNDLGIPGGYSPTHHIKSGSRAWWTKLATRPDLPRWDVSNYDASKTYVNNNMVRYQDKVYKTPTKSNFTVTGQAPNYVNTLWGKSSMTNCYLDWQPNTIYKAAVNNRGADGGMNQYGHKQQFATTEGSGYGPFVRDGDNCFTGKIGMGQTIPANNRPPVWTLVEQTPYQFVPIDQKDW